MAGERVIRTLSGRQAAVGAQGKWLFLIAPSEPGALGASVDAECVTLRDMIAVVRSVPFGRIEPTTPAIADYRGIVERVFATRTVVPAPFGTVFRSTDSLLRWMELHYTALREALQYVQNRQSARVRLTASEGQAQSDFERTVFDSMQVLSRHAVASVQRADGPGTVEVADASFLVAREQWGAFAAAVEETRERAAGVTIEQSGPWPAYDFVRLEFGT